MLINKIIRMKIEMILIIMEIMKKKIIMGMRWIMIITKKGSMMNKAIIMNMMKKMKI